MISPSNANVHTNPSPIGTGEKAPITGQCARANTSNAQNVAPAGVLIVRENHEKLGLPRSAIDIILASWRGSTGKQNNSFLSRWLQFCITNNISTDTAAVYDGLTFLTHLFGQGLGYSALNTARSVRSTIINLPNNCTFGEHMPLVSRFLKGVFELKPSLLCYSAIWDVGTVLLFMQTTPAAQNMTLKNLTKKLTTLLALITAQRCQTLAKLDIQFMQDISDKLVFNIRGKLKTTRPGKHLDPIKIVPYANDTKLCPVLHIREYIRRTEEFRQSSLLLLSYQKPHKPVTNATIGRWVKSTLLEAGIDVETFSAHSSRTASSSYGMLSGLTLQDVLKAGGWSNAETFARHCNKPITPNFGHSILAHFE